MSDIGHPFLGGTRVHFPPYPVLSRYGQRLSLRKGTQKQSAAQALTQTLFLEAVLRCLPRPWRVAAWLAVKALGNQFCRSHLLLSLLQRQWRQIRYFHEH
jgi:hypothetical protein